MCTRRAELHAVIHIMKTANVYCNQLRFAFMLLIKVSFEALPPWGVITRAFYVKTYNETCQHGWHSIPH